MVLSGVDEEVVLLHRREATEGGGHDQLTAPLRAEQFRGPRRDRRLEPLGDIEAVRARDQEFVHRQQALALQTNTTAVTRTAISP